MKTKLKQLAGAVVTVIFAAVSLTVPASAASSKIAAPSKITATVKNETSVTVSWSAVKSAAKYIVYYSDDAKTFKSYGSTDKTSATVKKLTTGTKYYFAVRSVDANGKKSAYSAAKSATPGKVAVNAENSIRVIISPGRVQNGKKATLKIQGAPETEYKLFVHYPSKSGEAKGIGAVISDKDGYASWTWTVGTRTTPGKHKITIQTGGNTYSLGEILETYKKNG